MDLVYIGLLYLVIWGVPLAITVFLVYEIYAVLTKGHEREDLSRMSHEHHPKDEVWSIAKKQDLEAFDRLVEKYSRREFSGPILDALQEAREKVKTNLAGVYRLSKRGRLPKEQCEGSLKEAYDQLYNKSDLIPSLNMLSEDEGASHYKSLFLKFLEKDNINL